MSAMINAATAVAELAAAAASLVAAVAACLRYRRRPQVDETARESGE